MTLLLLFGGASSVSVMRGFVEASASTSGLVLRQSQLTLTPVRAEVTMRGALRLYVPPGAPPQNARIIWRVSETMPNPTLHPTRRTPL